MLPPGHVAGGFLAAEALLKIAKPDLAPAQIHQLLWWGMFFGFAPDLDYFLTFAREKAFTVSDFKKNNHRRFPSHAPVLWLVAGLLIYFMVASEFVKYVGLMLWIGSWSHFLIDTIEYGVMWLWPLSSRKIYLRFQEDKNIPEKGFWNFWWGFIRFYSRTVSFYLEIAIIILALIVYFKI